MPPHPPLKVYNKFDYNTGTVYCNAAYLGSWACLHFYFFLTKVSYLSYFARIIIRKLRVRAAHAIRHIYFGGCSRMATRASRARAAPEPMGEHGLAPGSLRMDERTGEQPRTVYVVLFAPAGHDARRQ